MANNSQLAAWRKDLPVLVTDAQAMGSIAVIRSLGRGGYPVHACASVRDALGLCSRYAKIAVICPDHQDDRFVPWLREYVQTNQIRAIVPSESVLLTLRPVYEEFAHLLPFSPSAATLYAGLSKFDLFESLLTRAEHACLLPPTLLVADTAHLPSMDQMNQLGYPLYIKTDGCYALDRSMGHTFKVETPEVAESVLSQVASQFRKFIIQGHVPGQGVGVFFLIWNDRFVAEFMHRRKHELPGGVSSFRESWWHPAIRDDAFAKISSLGWQGVAMLEYRWDVGTDRFFLLEMNGRFWGSLHLALYAGVDFPCRLLDSLHGRLPDSVNGFPLGVRCRYTFPKEVQYVWSRLKDNKLPLTSKLWSVLEFFGLMIDPRVHSDLLFPGDRKLYWKSLKRFLLTLS